MKNRTSAGLVALVLGAALALSGCSSDDETGTPDPTQSSSPAPEEAAPTAEDVAALEAVKVTGDPGAAPTVEFETPFEVSTTTILSISDGDGAPLEDGQKLTLHSVVYSGNDASVLGNTYEGTPDSIVMGDANLIPQLTEALAGKNVGTRFLFANPSTESGTPVTYLTVAEITEARTIPSRAEGEAVAPADGLPTVTLDDAGAPSIEIPEGYEAPAELVVQPLIKGSGAQVTAEQTVTAHYSGWLLDGTPFDSSWEGGTPLSFSLAGGVIQGWSEGLAGQTVGSQVLLVIPAAKAYGANPPPGGTIPPDSPLIFVVDILDAE